VPVRVASEDETAGSGAGKSTSAQEKLSDEEPDDADKNLLGVSNMKDNKLLEGEITPYK
jgi:hypothetical protein